MSALFATLPESARSRRRSPLGVAVSVVAHAAAITLAVVATAKAGPDTATNLDEDRVVIWRPPVPPPTPITAERTPRGGSDGGRPTRTNPTTDPLPPVPVPTFDATGPKVDLPPVVDVGERWEGWGTATGRAGDPAGPGAGDVFTGPQVERAAALRGTVSPRYPAALRERGIEGSVTLRFVVDTTGRVEPGSVIVVSATHDQFADAARSTLASLRFTPAAAGGRRVRQLVELPFTFEIR